MLAYTAPHTTRVEEFVSEKRIGINVDGSGCVTPSPPPPPPPLPPTPPPPPPPPPPPTTTKILMTLH